MKNVLTILLFIGLAGCHLINPPKPAPTPTPPPPPPSTELLVRTNGTKFVRHDDGSPIRFEARIACCGAPDGSGWPSCSEEWVSRTAELGFTVVEFRIGPFMAASEGPEWEFGPYLENSGLADLTQWDERYWRRHREIASFARQKGIRVVVHVADGWYVKSTDRVMPWLSQYNIQGEDHHSPAGRFLTEVHRAWIRKVVDTFGDLDNILWLDGNEIGLKQGYSAENWTLAMRSLIRDIENERGFPVHVFGTNGREEAWGGDVDFVVLHTASGPAQAPVSGKPTYVNEYNPEPALTAEEILRNRCEARSSGTYYAFWWHSMKLEEAQNAMSRWNTEECTQISVCPVFLDGTSLTPVEPYSNAFGLIVNDVMSKLSGCDSGRCPVQDGRLVWQRKVIDALRLRGLCAGQHERDSDEIFVGVRIEGILEGYHVYAGPWEGPGTIVFAPQANRPAWRIAGPPPIPSPEQPPPTAEECGSPDPRGLPARFVLRPHGRPGGWDSTFQISSRAYCLSIGMDRNNCPVRPEGHPEREACEAAAIGQQRWWCDGEEIHSEANPAQAICHGYVETCTEDERVCETAGTPTA